MNQAAKVLIVGGGVCGTRLATLMQSERMPFLLTEARGVLGGRVRTVRTEEPPAYSDLGPSWVWPHQHTVLALLKELAIPTFEQYSTGHLVFEDGPTGKVRTVDMATMAGSLRALGGLQTLVERLAAQLDPESVWTGARLSRLERTSQGTTASFEDGRVVEAERVVLAMPARIAASTIAFVPELAAPLLAQMRAVPTWMAGHAKAVAVYPAPFWREHGLSGDGISHRGPLGELHDASPEDGSAGALFGFFGVSADWRRAHRERLGLLVRQQLAALYGPPAGEPTKLIIVDWADDPLVATAADTEPLLEHPKYGPLPPVDGAWKDALWMSGTELAPEEGGYVEGALLAAEAAFRSLG